MKKFILIMIIIIKSNLFCQWQNLGNTDRIMVSQKEISDYVISKDNKYIYTIDYLDTLKKWDLVTGICLTTRKIQFDSTLKKEPKYLFLSSDAATYIVRYNEFIKNRFFIFDINSDKYIDSLIIDIASPGILVGTRTQTCTDYDNSKKLFIHLCSYVVGSQLPYAGGNSGKVCVMIKTDSGWVSKYNSYGGSDICVINKDFSYLFMDNNNNSWIDNHGPNDYYGSSDYYLDNVILNLKKIIYKSLAYYRKKNDNGIITETGIKLKFNSAFFSIDGEKLYLSLSDSLYYSNLDTIKLKFIRGFEKYNRKTINILYSSDSNFFLINLDNYLDIYDFENYFFHRRIVFDSCNFIRKVKYSNDFQYIFAIDTSGNLYRIADNNIFSLKANFITPDTIVSQDDSAKFFDCSLGYPDDYLWDFGDGQSSKEKNPSHNYIDSGLYPVKLIVQKANKSDSIIKINLIKVIPFFKADFYYSETGTEPIEVNFINNSSGNIDSLKWDFGDSTFVRK